MGQMSGLEATAQERVERVKGSKKSKQAEQTLNMREIQQKYT